MDYNLSEDLKRRVANLHIAHSEIEKVWSMFDSTRRHRNLAMVNVDGSQRKSEMMKKHRHILLFGKSGTGKSELAMKYAMRESPIETYYDEELEADIDIMKVVYLETPENFGRLEFYQKVSGALGAPRLPGRPDVGEVRDRAINLLKRQKTEMMILDEIDYLITSNAIGLRPAMEAIKYVTNNAGVSLVCIGSPEAKKLRNLDLQYFRRFTPVELHRFESCNEDFCGFLQALEEQMKPIKPIGLGDENSYLPELLYSACKGIVGILTPIIIEAYN
ncbi:TniB family NTP-binding protein [Desulfitobacterium sp.]|uniref:TniB family NTP-binding protein n=1 Tax=Desulfitobacterium sp. TaxID=49981 RepID=UPI002B215736|nr:TniB family NTP-binding protein [Desulfitobacterium sp.]MEA4900706.1 TniB family NTP-binding protein [Desulfitobacterium sp.]